MAGTNGRWLRTAYWVIVFYPLILSGLVLDYSYTTQEKRERYLDISRSQNNRLEVGEWDRCYSLITVLHRRKASSFSLENVKAFHSNWMWYQGTADSQQTQCTEKCQHTMLLHNSLSFSISTSNSRHVHFNLTFQFQMLLQFGALNMGLVSTRSGWRPRQADNCKSHPAEIL